MNHVIDKYQVNNHINTVYYREFYRAIFTHAMEQDHPFIFTKDRLKLFCVQWAMAQVPYIMHQQYEDFNLKTLKLNVYTFLYDVHYTLNHGRCKVDLPPWNDIFPGLDLFLPEVHIK